MAPEPREREPGEDQPAGTTDARHGVFFDGGAVGADAVVIGINQGIVNQGIVNQFEADQRYSVHDLPNPYLGLRSFTYKDREAFAGREVITTKALRLLTAPGEERALLFITGASGSGKSSFVQAGLFPALEEHYQQQGLITGKAMFRPSRRPLAELASALAQLGVPLDGPFAAAAPYLPAYHAVAPRAAIGLLLIDQFEELFRQPEDSQAQAAEVLRLLAALPPFGDLRMHLIATLRSDFLPDLFEHSDLYEIAKQGLSLRAMNRNELRDAITRPLQLVAPDRCFEDALLDRLAADASADAAYLPLLQVSLEKLWRDGELRLSAYSNLIDAIRERAEDAYTFTDFDSTRQQPRSAGDQAAIMQIFLDLVDVSLDDNPRRDVRRQRTLRELARDNPERRRLITELADARLLSTGVVTEGDQAVEVVDIIHEALIANWDRLHKAIAAQRERLQKRAAFEQALREWERSGREKTHLLDNLRFAEAEELEREGDVALASPAARELLKRSRDARRDAQRRQLRRAYTVAATLAVLLLATTAALAVIYVQQRRTEAQRLAIAAQGLGEAPETALLIAHAALERDHNPETEQALRDAITRASWRPIVLSPPGAIDALPGLNAAVVSSDGQLIAAAADNGAAYLWGMDGAFRVALDGHREPVLALAFCPDSTRIATAAADGTARLWGVDGSLKAMLSGHDGPVTTIAFSLDGQQVLTAGDDGTARLWDSDGTELAVLEGHEDSVLRAIFSPDGTHIVTTSFDGTARLWDASGEPLAVLRGHDDNYGVLSAAFSADGQRVVTAAEDYTARIWELKGEPLQVLEGHGDLLYGAAFSPNGQRVVTVSEDGTARIWDADSGQVRATLRGHTSYVSRAAYSPDGRLIVTASRDGTARVWTADGALRTILQGHTDEVVEAVFSGDGKFIVTASRDGTARAWTVDGTPFPTLRHAEAVLSATFSPDGKRVVTASLDDTARVWNAQGKLLATLTDPAFAGEDADVNTAVFSPDGTMIVTALFNDVAQLWDADGNLLVTFEGHEDSVVSAAFSPDGQRIVTASDDTTARLWDLSGAELAQFQHEAAVQYATFTPDGQYIIAVSEGVAQVWGADDPSPSGGPLWKILVDDWINHTAVSPDGEQLALALGSESIEIWPLDQAANAPLHRLQGHDDLVSSVAFSPDGQHLLSASYDRTVRLWRIGDGAELGAYRFVTRVSSADFSPDGQQVIVALLDGTGRLYPPIDATDTLLQAAACHVGRGLTAAEQARFGVGAGTAVQRCSGRK